MPLLEAADSMGFKEKAAVLLAVIKVTQPDTTIPDKKGFIEKTILQSVQDDSAFQSQFVELAMMRINNPVFHTGELTLLDTANRHVLAWLCKRNSEELLVVLNMDEDNHALVAEMDYPAMEILFCNYDLVAPGPVKTSLALRPFEARVLKVH